MYSNTLKNFSWYTFAQIVIQIISFLSAIIVSRYLGPINLGLYSFTLNYVSTAIAVIAGIDFYCVWKLAKSEKKEEEVVTFIGHKLNIYVFLIFFGTIFAYYTIPKDVLVFVLVILVPSFLQSLSVFTLYTATTERARLLSLTQIASSVSLFLCKLGLVTLHAPLLSFIIIASIDLIINGVILFLYFIRKPLWQNIFLTKNKPSFSQTAKFLYAIKTSVVALGSWQILLRVDQIILAVMTNASTVGLYFAATKIAEMPNFLAGILSTALLQKISRASVNNSLQNKNNLKKLVLIFLSIGTIISLSIFFSASIIVSIIYGNTFKGADLILKIYSLSIPSLFLNYLFLSIFGSKEKHLLQMTIFIIAILVNITLATLLTPHFGAQGAAVSTVIAYSCSALLFYLALIKEKIV